MKIRHLVLPALALALAAPSVLRADVKTQERTRVQFAGALGSVVNFFGGKAAKEGIVETVAVKGDRMLSTNDTAGQIVDLGEEKVYQLDMKKKTYSVVTFAELRKQMEDAMAKAKKDAEAARAEQQKQQPEPEKAQPTQEYEVDFSVKESGRTRQVAGHDTRETIATVVVREKGKTLEAAGGMVMDTSLWMGPEIAALEELQAFRLRYAQKVYGPVVAQAAPDMTQAMAMYPMMQDAMAKFQAEGSKIAGTALLTEMRFQVQAPAQTAEEQQADSQKKEEPPPTSVGGLLGGLGRRMAKKKPEERKDDPSAVPGRATVLTTTTETLQIATSVADPDVAIPAGFKQKS